MQSATVNIQLSELMAVQRGKEEAEALAAKLQEQLREAVTKASDQLLLQAARMGIAITRFAVSQLPPESTMGWPTSDLIKLAELIPQLPDATIDDTELSITLASFARECETFERRRKGRQLLVVDEPVAAVE
jgi:hypothetical protein